MNYIEQREWDILLADIKAGDMFKYIGNEEKYKNKLFEAMRDVTSNPTTRWLLGHSGYISLDKLNTGDLVRQSRLPHNEKSLDKGEPIGKITSVSKDNDTVKITGVMNAPVVSDGKSSSYYTMFLNERLTKKIKEQIENNEPLNLITGDLIEMAFGNDFDFGNIEKALRRIWEAKNGRGKAGVDIKYDINKCRYFLDEIESKL